MLDDKSGRKLTTGKFETREELEKRIVFLYKERQMKISSIAYNCKISPGTAKNIIESVLGNETNTTKLAMN